MDFSLTDDQELLRDTARALLAKECPPSLLRAHMDDPSAADPLWKHLREWTAPTQTRNKTFQHRAAGARNGDK